MAAENAALLTDRAWRICRLMACSQPMRSGASGSRQTGLQVRTRYVGRLVFPPIRLSATLSRNGAREFFDEHL